MIHLRRGPLLHTNKYMTLFSQQFNPNYTNKLVSLFSSQNEKNQPTSKFEIPNPQEQNLNKNYAQNPSDSHKKQSIKLQEPIFTPEEQSLIKSYEPDETFNAVLNVKPNHNFQKDLILAKKAYEKTTKQLRANILFEDLLKSEVQILVYDTKGKPYTHMWFKNLFNVFFFGLVVWFFKSIGEKNPKNKVLFQKTTAGRGIKNIVYGIASWFLMIGFWRYLKFQRRFVQKVVYDTKSEKFLFTKRGFFGGKYENEISRFKIVYTENQFLNKKGTNYFNLDTKEEYSIPYKQSWIKQDLFSHLIAQRIKI